MGHRRDVEDVPSVVESWTAVQPDSERVGLQNLEGRTAVKKSCHTIRKQGKVDEQDLASFLAKNGQALLAMVDRVKQCQVACDELIEATGRAAIQAVLQLSGIAAAGGLRQQDKRRTGDVVFYGRQAGRGFLSDRKLEVQRPRLRSKGRGGKEVEVPAYAAMQNPTPMGARMLNILLHGVSARNHKEVTSPKPWS